MNILESNKALTTTYKGKYCLEKTIKCAEASNHLKYLTPGRRSLMNAKIKYDNKVYKQRKIQAVMRLRMKTDGEEELTNGFYAVSKRGVRRGVSRKIMEGENGSQNILLDQRINSPIQADREAKRKKSDVIKEQRCRKNKGKPSYLRYSFPLTIKGLILFMLMLTQTLMCKAEERKTSQLVMYEGEFFKCEIFSIVRPVVD